MALSAAAKALSLVLFFGALAGATYAVSQSIGGVQVELQPIVIEPIQTERQATPGHAVSFLISVDNRGASERRAHVEIDGAARGRSPEVTIPANSSIAVFVPVDVPAEAAVGEHALTVRVLSEERVLRSRENAVQLTVLPAAPGVEVGDRAEIRYVGRYADTARAFSSNDPELVGAAFLKSDQYQYNPAVLTVSTQPRNVIQGMYENVLGMQPGESRTFTFGFEKGYGPPSENTSVPRREVIERTLFAKNEVQRVARATFDEYITESGQGAPSDYAVGSTFTLAEEQNTWPYRITGITEEVVEYRLDAQIGDKFTLYPYWPQGSEIRAINETRVEFYTTPTTQPTREGECPPRDAGAGANCFTMRPEWPQMSGLDAAPNATQIVVRHDPPVQYPYTMTQGGETRQVAVAEVTATEIIVAVAAQNPLAGRSLTFDVTVLSVTKPPS